MGIMKNDYNESKKYSENIIEKIADVLKDNDIDYDIKSDGEIVINGNGQSKNSLEKTIYGSLDIPKVVFLVLIDIIDIDGTIYIRQKTK